MHALDVKAGMIAQRATMKKDAGAPQAQHGDTGGFRNRSDFRSAGNQWFG
jgi:hypothetical protein